MKIILAASTTGYQVRSFAAAAERVGATIVHATDRCHVLENPWGDDAVPIQFDDPSANLAANAAASLEALTARGPFAGIVAVGDRPALAAAALAERLGLRFSRPEAARAANNKLLSPLRFPSAGLPTPPHSLEYPAGFPCWLEAPAQSASQGVIRANV